VVHHWGERGHHSSWTPAALRQGRYTVAATRPDPQCSPDPTRSGLLLLEEPTLARKEEEPLMKVTRPFPHLADPGRRKAVVRHR
jgi:hypothetical protein